jgi:hypothetical protein
MSEDHAQGQEVVLRKPVLWGLLSTLLLACLGLVSTKIGAWPLLWLPLFSPVIAGIYTRFILHEAINFGRFLIGYGIGLFVIVTAGTVIFAVLM